ncbi:hypothetical protein NQ314_003640 [Rhamnusium bicolor]|uniref:DDE Tnp4 domain-containing protein n=1 Tax=Rhamnusium bicolor TaxID=1586634 RepID=A0AAV8ZPC5_9CUCU|nr:hypothetical protein NQ314_003640 [Rhamnusium bicolor]
MRPKNRETDLDIKTRVLIALKFYAGGSYQLDIACNKYLDVSQSTVSRCLAEVTGALNHPDVFNEWVKFPHNFEKLNKTRLETHTDYYLLGDSGYPLRSWLLTPLEEEPAQNTPEHTYNSIHKTTRVKTECCNGLLKGRFRCLIKHRVLHYNPAFSCKIINACAVLHNMCIEYNIPAPDLEDEGIEIDFGMLGENEVIFAENEEDNAFRRVNPELANGRRARSKLSDLEFSNSSKNIAIYQLKPENKSNVNQKLFGALAVRLGKKV